MKRKFFSIASIVVLACIMTCCQNLKDEKAKALGQVARIFPAYADVTMPPNIAPPTFMMADSSARGVSQAVFESGSTKCVVPYDEEDGFCIPKDDWHSLVSAGGKIKVRIQGENISGANAGWEEYEPFSLYISKDSIDSYLAYRLIEPGYEVWNRMGIYQRNLETYEESAIFTNEQSNGGCVNCHSFRSRDPKDMLLHLRLELAGTYIRRDGSQEHLTPDPSFVYPYWHPSGRYVAFSTNNTKQMFHTTDRNRIEVFDYASDVIVYDIDGKKVLTCPQIHSAEQFETFPSFSPDGKTLYFCSADSVPIPKDYDKVHYSLCSISFDASDGTFGTEVDTLYNARKEGGSASFPRVSPDGRYLVFTHHGYGNFSIWHKDADLWMIDLSQKDGQAQAHAIPNINSQDVDSYHSWSSNSRWLVFSTRRDDGLYTRPYICHIDNNGKASKPFPLPQSDASYYKRLMKSYNIPEFISGKVSPLIP